MQAVLAKGALREIKNIKGSLRALFENLENADNNKKSEIENSIVSYGESAIDFLIDKLTGSKGIQRGVAAMSLIRIGEGSINSLKQLAETDKNYSWVADYIIKEIEGTF
ncbi:MAG: hypothetical protein LUE64_01045 [Candidatus Gastranaerophilales bacterium]|nr:hypothetical protein [Candidatus Gastranaerophilales bacterium]